MKRVFVWSLPRARRQISSIMLQVEYGGSSTLRGGRGLVRSVVASGCGALSPVRRGGRSRCHGVPGLAAVSCPGCRRTKTHEKHFYTPNYATFPAKITRSIHTRRHFDYIEMRAQGCVSARLTRTLTKSYSTK